MGASGAEEGVTSQSCTRRVAQTKRAIMKFREHILSYAAYIALANTHRHAHARTNTHGNTHTHTHSVRYLLFQRRQELPSGFTLAMALAVALALVLALASTSAWAGFPLS